MTSAAHTVKPAGGRAAPGRDYALLWTGQLFSMSGTMIQYIALPLWVLAETGSALASGLTFAVETLPVIVLAPWAGVLADRLDRRRLVLAGEVLSVGLVLALLGAVALRSVPAALVCAALIKTVNTVTVPALQGLIREVVPEPALPAAVSRFEGLTGATIVLGPPAGALLFAHLGPAAALLVNAASFAASALCVLALRTRRPAPAQTGTSARAGTAAQAGTSEPAGTAAQARPRLGAGFTLVRSTARLRSLLCAEAAYFLFFGGATAAVIVAASERLGESQAGWYPACVGAAWVFVSMVVLPSRDWSPRTSLLLGAAFVPLTAVAVALMGAAPLPLMLLAGVLGGVANSFIAAGASIGWQKETDTAMIGQVMALRRSVANAALATSSVLLPALADTYALGPVILIGSVAAAGLTAAFLAGWHKAGAAA